MLIQISLRLSRLKKRQKKMESTGERHLNWDFTQKDWNGKYSASGREDIGKYTTGENK